MNKRTEIILYVNEHAEKFYDQSQEIGTLAAQLFFIEIHPEHQRRDSSHEKEKKELEKHRAQMTNLENIAETTLKITDVLDFIKKQIARPNQEGWRKEYQGKRFGESLKQFIENDIKQEVELICIKVKVGNESETDKRERQQIYLHLIRQFIRQVVVQYEYRVSQLVEESQNDKRTGTGTHTASQR